MNSLSPTLWLCTAMLVVAASALSAFDMTQRTYRGFQWWTCALWLNVAGAAAIVWLDAAHMTLPLLQLVFVPWPLLCLLGLRRFHARVALAGSARADLALLVALLVGASTAPRLLGDAALVELMPLMAASAALLYAAVVAWSAPKGHEAHGLTSLGALWLVVALLPALGSAWGMAVHGAALQASVVALGSTVMAFMALTLSSQRTERELRQSRSRLRVLANIDMLTQVPNRRRFEELARRALQSDEDGSAALLLVDIDHFKRYNDTHGHNAGDAALREVARVATTVVRRSDVVGRWGGDEFVLLLPLCDATAAARIAGSLAAAVQDGDPERAGRPAPISISTGVAELRPTDRLSDVVARADDAMYRSRRARRAASQRPARRSPTRR